MNFKEHIKKIPFYIVFLVMLYVFYNMVILSDQVKIKKRIIKLRKAVIERDTNKILSFISLKYSDSYGLTFALIYSSINEFFESVKSIEGEIVPLSVYIYREGDTKFGIATVELWGHLEYSSNRYQEYEKYNDRKFIVEIKFIKEPGRWRIIEFVDFREV